ncbi:hypothetical protein [Alteribacter aurantiacus]|uniref:hypothetical protein n=1 Tax=Alteribacter aurantiacus TaxID=254410 RepID=UPI00040DA2CA|nr:hypothetical protein [Alteribacter aurantiacus]
MNVQVHTYCNPKNWRAHPLYSSFKDALHICATNNQKIGIKSCYEELTNVYSFREFIQALYVRWYSPETRFQQYLRLSKQINDLKDVPPELKQAFRINTLDILDSIRFFVQANIYPDALVDQWLNTDKEVLFKKVWKLFAEEDEATHNHYKALQQPILIKEFERVVLKLQDVCLQTTNELHIVLHGFYFVTPEQQTFFEILRNQNIKITFFHYYDNRYTETFDFIKAFVTDRFGWPSPENWIYYQTQTDLPEVTQHADLFLSSYEGAEVQQKKLTTEVTAYESFFDFLHDVILPHYPIKGIQKEESKQVSVLSPNAEQLNEMLLSYYPELNKKKRNFLAYPIGRFLVSLHQMYDKGQMIITDDIVISLFSSGWLYDEYTHENAQDYTYDFEQLRPYMQGCEKIDAWILRLEQLIQQGLTIEQAFPVGQENRITRSVRSPFAKISHFSIPLHRVKQIKTFIENVQVIAKTLFSDSSSNTIDVHFTRLKGILRKYGKGVGQIANEDEKLLISELQVKLNQIEDQSEFLYADLQTALNFYLSGKLDDQDETYINGFIEIDGEMFKSPDKHIYVTGLDENSLPLSSQSLPWPVQPDTFERLSEQHHALQLLTIRSRASKYISRYLFFIALNISPQQVSLSWIKNLLDQQELEPALYIKQIGLKTNKPQDREDLAESTYIHYDLSHIKASDEEIEAGWKTVGFEDFIAEYVLCPKRFYYSFIVNEYPTFSSDFIHQFIFSEIIRVAGQGTKADYEVVMNEISPLFPQWLEFKKQVSGKIAFRYVPNQLGKKTTVVNEHSYTETRKHFQFPGMTKDVRNELFDRTKQSYERVINELVEADDHVISAKPSYNCRFCPHIDYCGDAIHSIDLRKGKS